MKKILFAVFSIMLAIVMLKAQQYSGALGGQQSSGVTSGAQYSGTVGGQESSGVTSGVHAGYGQTPKPQGTNQYTGTIGVGGQGGQQYSGTISAGGVPQGHGVVRFSVGSVVKGPVDRNGQVIDAVSLLDPNCRGACPAVVGRNPQYSIERSNNLAEAIDIKNVQDSPGMPLDSIRPTKGTTIRYSINIAGRDVPVPELFSNPVYQGRIGTNPTYYFGRSTNEYMSVAPDIMEILEVR